MPLMLVTLPRDQKGIFKISVLDNLKIKVEPQESKTSVTQCHRCQLYGHSQSKCKAPTKCLKCAGNNLSFECKKPKVTPATCANCGGSHPANSKDCKFHPINKPVRNDLANQSNGSKSPLLLRNLYGGHKTTQIFEIPPNPALPNPSIQISTRRAILRYLSCSIICANSSRCSCLVCKVKLGR